MLFLEIRSNLNNVGHLFRSIRRDVLSFFSILDIIKWPKNWDHS